MNPAIAMPEAPRKGRGRLQLLLILAIVIGPMLLASAMYKGNFKLDQLIITFSRYNI